MIIELFRRAVGRVADANMRGVTALAVPAALAGAVSLLKALRSAGLVSTTRRAQGVVYELADALVHRIAVDAIDHAGELWPA